MVILRILLGIVGLGVVLATFGWWEIICPTETMLHALCTRLANRRVIVCTVTGLPAAAVQAYLDGRFGYVWVGDWHAHSQGVGLLVAKPWKDDIPRLAPHPAVASRRHVFCKLPGSVLGIGAYGPCVGSLPVE